MSLTGRWTRNACCPYDQPDVPSVPENLNIFTISGFFYSKAPVWYNPEQNPLLPTQFHLDYNNLKYIYTFYTLDSKDKKYYLSTTENVIPIITNHKTGRKAVVKNLTHPHLKNTKGHPSDYQNNGQTIWEILW